MRRTHLLGGLLAGAALVLAGCTGDDGVSRDEIVGAVQDQTDFEADDATGECIADGMLAVFSQEELEEFAEDPASSEISEQVGGITAACLLTSDDEGARDAIVAQYVDSGLDEEEAECFVDGLIDSGLDEEQLSKLGDTDNASDELQAVLAELGRSCLPGGPDGDLQTDAEPDDDPTTTTE